MATAEALARQTIDQLLNAASWSGQDTKCPRRTFDASLIGLTATPSKQTFGFFNQNLVMEYGHEPAVADGVNVNYDVRRDRLTRKRNWEQLDEEFAHDPQQLDRDVQTPDQIRVLLEISPGRSRAPKRLIFAKDVVAPSKPCF
jgi:type I restriction enzyme R subunit